MPWLELQLTIGATHQPRAEAALEELGALSVTLMDAAADTPDEAAIFEPRVGETPLWESLRLLALFDVGTDRRGLSHALHDAMRDLAPDRIAFRDVADQVWERAWMDRFRPMRFGRRLWIYPWNMEPPTRQDPHAVPSLASGAAGNAVAMASGKDAPHPLPSPASGGGGVGVALRTTPSLIEAGGVGVALRTTSSFNEAPVVVRLDPGLAFGSGTHPTTALCLEWLDALDLSGRSVVDYGCGSGVLAIAALKLGAARAIVIDHDPQALAATRENAARNGVADRLSPVDPDGLAEGTHADVLVANILGEPLHALAPRFARLLRPGASFALSGILAGQEATLLERYAGCGFGDLAVTERAGWMRIDGRFRGNA